MRGKWFKWNNIPVLVTYHPSYLLRAYNQDAKREAGRPQDYSLRLRLRSSI
jgi:uracil-DNA glycosylase